MFFSFFLFPADQFVIDLDAGVSEDELTYSCSYDSATDSANWKRVDPLTGNEVMDIPICLSQCLQNPYNRPDLVKAYDGSVSLILKFNCKYLEALLINNIEGILCIIL